jgi:hypothetical protein
MADHLKHRVAHHRTVVLAGDDGALGESLQQIQNVIGEGVVAAHRFDRIDVERAAKD